MNEVKKLQGFCQIPVVKLKKAFLENKRNNENHNTKIEG